MRNFVVDSHDTLLAYCALQNKYKKLCSHPLFSSPLPSWACCFSCLSDHAAARCSQDGIIRENVCAAYFSQGLSLANYCLDGSQRFSPITCIFFSPPAPTSSLAWTPSKASVRSVTVQCFLWHWLYQCPEKWHVETRSSCFKFRRAEGLDMRREETSHVPLVS